MDRFLEALKERKARLVTPVIPDIKCFSPKEGNLLQGRDPVRYARDLVHAGAPVLSVVTEEQEFHGSMELFRAICAAVHVPVLRKDFIENVSDLEETKRAGGSAILLMYSCLGREKLETLYREAVRIGLTPFVETHTKEELSWAGELGAPLVGINNRNILMLERDDGDVSYASELLEYAPENAFLVAESGLRDGRDVRRAVRAGADAVLVGTAILTAPDPALMLKAMMRPCDLKICGVMNVEDAALCLRAQADTIGIVTEYPVDVPWNLGREETDRIIDALRHMEDGRPEICIVTGGSVDQVTALAKDLRPDAVQLHYRENLAELETISAVLHKEGIRVVRSIPPDPDQCAQMFGTERLQDIFKRIREAGADAGLLDMRDAANAASGGGSILENGTFADGDSSLLGETAGKGEGGASFRKRAKTNRNDIALVIGGGITSRNAWEAYMRFRPDVIDVMTGVETAPGRKNASMLKELIDALACGEGGS